MIELLSSKQMRMLELLDENITACTGCTLCENGRAKPYWTPMSVYLALGEAPGKTEVQQNEPFVGKAGQILAEVMHDQGLRKEQFLFINTVNCRPMNGDRNGKPSGIQMHACKQWIRKYIRVLNPEKMIAFGDYAISTMDGGSGGVTRKNGKVNSLHYFDGKYIGDDNERGVPVVYSVHPAFVIYNKSAVDMLKTSAKIFYYVQ